MRIVTAFRQERFIDPFNNPTEEQAGLEEIDDICLRTLQALSNIEKARQTEPLSIDSLARVDVGLVLGHDQNLQYYVNEISRHPCSLMEHLFQQATNIECMAYWVMDGLIQTYKHHVVMYPSQLHRHNISL